MNCEVRCANITSMCLTFRQQIDDLIGHTVYQNHIWGVV